MDRGNEKEKQQDTKRKGMGNRCREEAGAQAVRIKPSKATLFLCSNWALLAGMNESDPFSTSFLFAIPQHRIKNVEHFDSFFICMVQYKDIRMRKIDICHKEIIACKRQVA